MFFLHSTDTYKLQSTLLGRYSVYSIQGDHSPDNVKFPDNSLYSATAPGMLSVTHMPILVLNTCMNANMQFTINSFRQLFRDKIFSLKFPWLIFSKNPDISLTAVKFPDISRFSRRVVTLSILLLQLLSLQFLSWCFRTIISYRYCNISCACEKIYLHCIFAMQAHFCNASTVDSPPHTSVSARFVTCRKWRSASDCPTLGEQCASPRKTAATAFEVMSQVSRSRL